MEGKDEIWVIQWIIWYNWDDFLQHISDDARTVWVVTNLAVAEGGGKFGLWVLGGVGGMPAYRWAQPPGSEGGWSWHRVVQPLWKKWGLGRGLCRWLGFRASRFSDGQHGLWWGGNWLLGKPTDGDSELAYYCGRSGPLGWVPFPSCPGLQWSGPWMSGTSPLSNAQHGGWTFGSGWACGVLWKISPHWQCFHICIQSCYCLPHPRPVSPTTAFWLGRNCTNDIEHLIHVQNLHNSDVDKEHICGSERDIIFLKELFLTLGPMIRAQWYDWCTLMCFQGGPFACHPHGHIGQGGDKTDWMWLAWWW